MWEVNAILGLINIRKWLNVGTFPTFQKLNVGTVPTSKKLKVGTVLTFETLSVGTMTNLFGRGGGGEH